MSNNFDLLTIEDGRHSLLEPATPAYTNVTVRRALIVWLHTGQQNEFRNVCNYFHRLEALEDKMPAEARATSRHHEFSLLSAYPPISRYLTDTYPKLYRYNKNEKLKAKQIEEIKFDDCVFNIEGFHNLKIHKNVTTKDIIKTSQMIRRYCKSHSKTLKVFLAEFKDFTKKTEVTNSVHNIMVYIKKKYLKDELATLQNMPKTFDFLDDFDIENEITDNKIYKLEHTSTPINNNTILTENTNKIRILINESRKKELLPHFPEIALKDCENNITAKLIKLNKKQIKEHFDSSNI